MTLGKCWGYDTETVEKNGGGFPYSFQLTHGDIQLFHEQKNLSPSMFRGALLKTIERYCEDGDSLWSYNLAFENGSLLRDMLYLWRDNRISVRFGNCRISGILEDPTPFLQLDFPNKRVFMLDAAKYFQGDHGGTLEEVAGDLLPLKKMKRPGYLGKRVPRSGEIKYFKNYAMMDAILAEGLGEYAKKYHQEAGQESWCFSAAHLAGQYFNRGFTEGEKLDLANPRIEGGAVWARFGGYRRGWQGPGVYENYCHLDLKSAYPWAYSGMRAYWRGEYVRTKKIPSDGESITKIETILPANEIRSLFQKRGKHGEILTQAINTHIRFWTTGAEILAYRRVWPQWKFNILENYEWRGQSKSRPLHEWERHFFKIKNSVDKEDKKNAWRRNFAKAMLNHITGKFDSSIKMSEETWLTANGPMTFMDTRPGSLRNYFVAAIIRGKVRAWVWGCSRYWQQFPVKPSIQEMTDSIDVPISELHRFKLSNRLGGWEEECRGDMIFLRTGTYVYFDKGKEKKVAYHGIQMKDKKTGKFSVKKFFKFLAKGGGTYTRNRMVRVKEALRKDGVQGTTAFSFHEKPFNLKISNTFKGEFLSWLKAKRVRF